MVVHYGSYVTLASDLAAEGEPEKEFHPGIASRLPRKRAAAGALIRDRQGRILFVVPAYKPVWDIPGGIVDENESPLAACAREVREELDLVLPIGQLLVVDWLPRHGVWPDGLMFIFDGGVLDDAQVASLAIADDELTAFQLATIEEAAAKLQPSMLRRVRTALNALSDGQSRYAEFGRPL
jgi:ADP-ribose pyrophosphatase YjhB (NUDIX family)